MKVEDLKVGEIYKFASGCKLFIHLVDNHIGGVFVNSVQLVSISQNEKMVIVTPLSEMKGENFYYTYREHNIKLTLNMEKFLEIIKDDIDIKNKTTPPQLEDGMVVEICDNKYLIIDNKLFTVSTRSEYDLKNQGWYSHLRNTNYKIKKDSINDYTDVISKVYKVKNPYYTQLTTNPLFSPSNLELIWEREPIKTMTQAEIEEELGYKIKIDFIK